MNACAPLAEPPCWFEASVPVLQRYLERLAGLLDTAERHVRQTVASVPGGGDAQGCPVVEAALAALLAARLAPDMLPLERQVVIAANFALRIAFPLAGLPLPAYPAHPPTLAGLRAHVGEVQAHLARLARQDRARYADAGARLIDSMAGEAALRLPAPVFLWQYALPNFHFHLTMTYALLRQQGVPLGKADYDGWHVYPRTAPAATSLATAGTSTGD